MSNNIRVLVLEDSPADALLMIHELRRAGFTPAWERVEGEGDFLAALSPELNLVLADYTLPQFDALRALAILSEQGLDVPLIVVTGRLEELGLECLKRGADDYLLKDRLARLGPAVAQALERRRAQAERRRADAAREELAALNQAVLRSLDAHIAVLDPEGLIVAVNDAWGAFGRANGAPEGGGTGVGTSYLEVCRRSAEAGEPLAAQAAMGLEEILGGARASFALEYACHGPNEERWFIMRARPLVGRRGAIVLHESVTERRKLELQLQHAQRFESLGRMAGGIAHDFNNLLGAISGHAELLAELHPASPAIQRRAGAIMQATESAASLTQQLLAFARRQQLDPRPVSLNEVVLASMNLLAPLAGSTVRLEAALDPGLREVLADPEQIKQVIVNLVVNACDALPEGGTVTLSTANGGAAAGQPASAKLVTLEVRDTGTGMPPAVLARAFEPFFTTKEPGRGTGLGLATCYGIVHQHGGQISIASEVGKGTRVLIALPAIGGQAAPGHRA